MASHEPAPQVHNGVSTLDVPSAAWGYSAVKRTTIQVTGWISVLWLLGLNFGNHEGHVETIYLFIFAILIALGLLIHLFEPKLSQVRTITGRNKGENHKEPEWAYQQATLTGVYAELTDSQLRSMNIDPARVAQLRAGQRNESIEG